MSLSPVGADIHSELNIFRGSRRRPPGLAAGAGPPGPGGAGSARPRGVGGD